MAVYDIFRNAAFRMDPEEAHHKGLKALQLLGKLGGAKCLGGKVPDQPVKLLGLTFKNPVGLAAGLDKDGICIDALGDLGFGFLEIGTVTPRPQPGNDKPRLFRIPEAQAIINRMGFNNGGVDALVERARQRGFKGVLGVNIGKNKDTPNEDAESDYRIGFRKAAPVADYVAVNISSPNTQGLRDLQSEDALKRLLHGLKEEQAASEKASGKRTPIAVKIAPDLDDLGVVAAGNLFLAFGVDAVIATNTTISRTGVDQFETSKETGGLSGAPVKERSTQVIRLLRDTLAGKMPIIGVGGIIAAEDAGEKFEAGADLVQIYTGFIYRGPALIREIVEACQAESTEG